MVAVLVLEVVVILLADQVVQVVAEVMDQEVEVQVINLQYLQLKVKMVHLLTHQINQVLEIQQVVVAVQVLQLLVTLAHPFKVDLEHQHKW